MLSTRLVMLASSICLGAAGIVCLFAPVAVGSVFAIADAEPLVVQMLGALYLASAASNWTARSAMVGGIYARPLSVANFMHFLVGAIVLAKGLAPGNLSLAYVLITLAYLVFAILFILMLYGRLERTGEANGA